MVPALVSMIQAQIRFQKKSHDPFLIAPFKPEPSVVILDGASLFTVEKFQLVECIVLVQAVEDGSEFEIATDMVRLFLYFGRLQTYTLLQAKRKPGPGFQSFGRQGFEMGILPQTN